MSALVLRTFNPYALVATHEALATASRLTALVTLYEIITQDAIPNAQDAHEWADASRLCDAASAIWDELKAYRLGVRGWDGITLLCMGRP